MSDMTEDQLAAGFIHQVRMYQGVGREKMHRIVDVLFYERGREVAADALEICVAERIKEFKEGAEGELEKDLVGILRRIDEKEGK